MEMKSIYTFKKIFKFSSLIKSITKLETFESFEWFILAVNLIWIHPKSRYKRDNYKTLIRIYDSLPPSQ